MNPIRNSAFGLVFLVLISAGASAEIMQYKATLLHPLTGYQSTSALGVSGSAQVGSGYGGATSDFIHALMWNGTPGSVVDLHPNGAIRSSAWDVDGNSQVGGGEMNANGRLHAFLWHGTAASVVDLHPAGFEFSFAEGVSGNSQVGYGSQTLSTDNQRALLWQGTAGSVVNLHPTGFEASAAHDVDGNTQVGHGTFVNSLNFLVDRALMWQGTAESVVNLHPSTGYDSSRLEGVSGNVQVGSAVPDGSARHAMLWQGTAASFVDLQPAGYSNSNALGVAGVLQVGFGRPTGSSNDHALVWNGSAADFLDLHSTILQLSDQFVGSQAFGIADNGHIVGVAVNQIGTQYAVLWTPIPEPGTAVLFLSAVGGLVCAINRNRAWKG